MGKGTDIKLGINGLGRIGKLTLWHHVSNRYFREIVVNTGREVGKSLADLVHYIVRDSTYGSLPMYLHGCQSGDVIQDVNDSAGTMTINGTKITFLRNARDPREVEWKKHNVELVVDTTGEFLDPTLPGDAPKGAVRGHLEAGAGRVIVSALLLGAACTAASAVGSGDVVPEPKQTVLISIPATSSPHSILILAQLCPCLTMSVILTYFFFAGPAGACGLL